MWEEGGEAIPVHGRPQEQGAPQARQPIEGGGREPGEGGEGLLQEQA